MRAGICQTNKEFHAFRNLIFQEAGISLGDAKRALVASRLARRLRHYGFTSYAQYYHYLMDQDLDGQERVRFLPLRGSVYRLR